jgi:phosphoglycolate phosphatase-like HAD superfamily hydrolase
MAELGDPVPEETIVIGDTPYDAIAARKAGLQTIGMLSGGFPEDWLKNEGCVEIYKNPSDLLARYEESLLCEKKTQATNLSSVISALLL